MGWTYVRAYERGQKYKEGRFIFEKAKVYLEENEGAEHLGVALQGGGQGEGWRKRTMSWGEEEEVWEYKRSRE